MRECFICCCEQNCFVECGVCNKECCIDCYNKLEEKSSNVISPIFKIPLVFKKCPFCNIHYIRDKLQFILTNGLHLRKKLEKDNELFTPNIILCYNYSMKKLKEEGFNIVKYNVDRGIVL